MLTHPKIAGPKQYVSTLNQGKRRRFQRSAQKCSNILAGIVGCVNLCWLKLSFWASSILVCLEHPLYLYLPLALLPVRGCHSIVAFILDIALSTCIFISFFFQSCTEPLFGCECRCSGASVYPVVLYFNIPLSLGLCVTRNLRSISCMGCWAWLGTYVMGG